MILSRKIRSVFNNIENDFWFKKKSNQFCMSKKSDLYLMKIHISFVC